MKPSILILLALFSFSASTRYEVEEHRCKNNKIEIKYENKWYDISLFNVVLKENVDVCKYINGNISVEWEKNINYEDMYSVYVFIDDKLLQKTLYENEEAIIINPSIAYKYSIKEESVPVFKEIQEETNEKEHGSLISGWIIILMYVLFCVFWVFGKIHNRNRMKQDKNNV